jgi:MFS family permease
MVGNILLCLGMIGVALIRKEVLHFLLFSGHIIGYSIADTALVSLISRYSSPNSQGRDLSFNQAAQSVARVLSPLVSGLLYEQSKKSKSLPLGALPFLIGSFFPALAIIIPSILYCESISKKQNQKV